MAFSFDGTTKKITLSLGTVEIDCVDLYSRWVDWAALSDNSKYLPAVRTVGGDAVSATQNLGITFFLTNGWRIVPQSADHRLKISGNLYTEPFGDSVCDGVPGYSVIVEMTVSNLVDSSVARLEVENIQRLIENLRPHHTGTGNIFFWNPVTGSDSNDGQTPTTACLTFAHIHDNLVTDYGHDIVMAQPASTGVTAITTAAEVVTISKNYVFLRGPGRDFEIDTTLLGGAGVHITGKGVELAGVRIKTGLGGTDPALSISADFASIRNVWVEQCGGDAINITTSNNTIIEGGHFRAYKGHGVNVGNSVNHLWLRDIGLHGTSGNGDGLHINGTSVYEVKLVGRCDIHANAGYGVNVLSSSTRITIDSDAVIESNTLGDLNDPYNKLIYTGRVWAENMVVPQISAGTAPTAEENAVAVRALLSEDILDIHNNITTRVARGEIIPVNMLTIGGKLITGSGTKMDPWRPA